MITLKNIEDSLNIHPSRIHNAYIFGSRVYGTHTKESDWDVIVVANNSVEAIEIDNGDLNIHVYTPDKFKKDLDWHRINNLECIYAPKWAILKENIDYKTDFEISIPKIRHAISHVSSNSWVKAKKKILQGDQYIGIKSLYHSIRIPIFARQLLEDGYISFDSTASLWDDITSSEMDWDSLFYKYKPLHNNVLSEFRKLAPKNK
jgi:predicted nucleotidyltransferase